MTSSSRQLQEKIAAEAEQAEATPDAELHYRRRQPKRSSVYGLRLPDERIEQLRRLAEARGIEPSTLVRQWVIEHLDDSEQAIGGSERRTAEWERDVRSTTDHLRQLLDERPWTKGG
jgi:predicted DNA-binding protein